jgi:hypothetical protein
MNVRNAVLRRWKLVKKNLKSNLAHGKLLNVLLVEQQLRNLAWKRLKVQCLHKFKDKNVYKTR